jgi:hypothetical protein
VTVAGIGTATITDPVDAISRPAAPDGGFFPLIGSFNGSLFTANSVFATYNLSTPIAPPVSGSFSSNLGGGPAIDTSLGTGTLLFSSFGSTSTFGATATATPEPSSFVLLGLGAIYSLGYGWRRRKQTAACSS